MPLLSRTRWLALASLAASSAIPANLPAQEAAPSGPASPLAVEPSSPTELFRDSQLLVEHVLEVGAFQRRIVGSNERHVAVFPIAKLREAIAFRRPRLWEGEGGDC